MTDYIFVILLILHVGSIVGWMGASFVFGSVLGPSVLKMTAQGRGEFYLNVIPRYARYVLATSIASIIFGLLLYGYSVMPNSTVAPSASGLIWIQAGSAIGVIAFVLVLAWIWPLGRKFSGLAGDSRPGGQEIAESTQKKLRMGVGVVSGLLAIVLILMITGAVI